MPVWSETIDLRSIWRADIEFPHKRDEIVSRIKASVWYRNAQHSTYHEGLVAIVVDLSLSQSISEFDTWMHELYDQADSDRVWIQTF